jgi:hypothetical protein
MDFYYFIIYAYLSRFNGIELYKKKKKKKISFIIIVYCQRVLFKNEFLAANCNSQIRFTIEYCIE